MIIDWMTDEEMVKEYCADNGINYCEQLLAVVNMTTVRKYLIQEAAKPMLGKVGAMSVYMDLSVRFNLPPERVRKIVNNY